MSEKPQNTETHLTFFGNLNAAFKYSSIEEEFGKHISSIVTAYNQKVEERRAELSEIDKEKKWLMDFEYRSVESSIIDKKQFADSYLNDIVYAHFHLGVICFSECLQGLPNFKLSQETIDYGVLDCFSTMEFTIFRNGMFAFTFHIVSNVDMEETEPANGLSCSAYLKQIEKIDYIKEKKTGSAQYETNEILPGKLINELFEVFVDYVIYQILKFINLLQADLRSLCPLDNAIDGKRYNFEYDRNNNTVRDANISKCNPHCNNIQIDIYRPYIGTYLVWPVTDLCEAIENKSLIEKCQRFLIASARATEELFGTFEKSNRYLNFGYPPRNIFAPRKDRMLYVSLRGWSCVRIVAIEEWKKMQKSMEAKTFRTEVIESVSIIMQTIQTGMIAARNLQRELNNKGRSQMMDLLDFNQKHALIRFICFLQKNRLVFKYTRFLHRMRIHSTSNELYLNMPAFVKGHTARTVTERLLLLGKFSDTVENTKNTLESYQSFLTKFSQQAAQSNLIFMALSLVAVIILGILQLLKNCPN